MEDHLENILNFEDLPNEIKSQITGSNPEQAWHSMTIVYHINNHIRWKGPEYTDFYRDLIRFLRLKLEIFPYHLCRYLNFTSPFDYYIEMLCDLLRTQKEYDCLPTFTAADILRIVGIHRNTYTELLQKCKEKGWVSKISRAVRNMLPKNPLSTPAEGWWIVFPLLHKKPRKSANKIEVDCLHEIYKDFTSGSGNFAGQYNKEALEGLYKGMVVDFDIEIDELKFELTRDIKSFINDKTGFGKQLGQILKLCESYNEIEDIMCCTDLDKNIVKDCLSILSRLGFIDVVAINTSQWHKSWQPLTDRENSVSSAIPSIENSNTEEYLKVTLATGKVCNGLTAKTIREVFGKIQVEVLESDNPALVLNTPSLDPIVFANLEANEFPLYRLFKSKYCKCAPVVYILRGFVMTVIPQSLAGYSYFLVDSDDVVKEIHRNDLLNELTRLLALASVFVIPLKSRFISSVTVPLPLNIVSVKDRALVAWLRELNLIAHFENFVGHLEIAALADKKFVFLNQFHGIPYGHKDLALSVCGNMLESSWFKYSNLDIVADAQQNEIFQYREFICNISTDEGIIVVT